MKKNIILFVLFVLPIVAYLFFASGVNSFTKLPVITKNVPEFENWPSLSNRPVVLNGKITILAFGGSNLLENRGNFFNLNQKVYQRYHDFKDLQFVVICPESARLQAQKLLDSFKSFTDVSRWEFLFVPNDQIVSWHKSLNVSGNLDQYLATSMVYIIDKDKNLRGRKDNSKVISGYDAFHPSILSNEMLDDFKILLYEYRAALKKNHNASKPITKSSENEK